MYVALHLQCCNWGEWFWERGYAHDIRPRRSARWRYPYTVERKPDSVRQLPMRVNIRLSSIRRGPRPGLSPVARRPPWLFELRRARKEKAAP
jgi:hypothetical protein